MFVDASMSTWCILPAELVREILSYTTPLDLVRWRTVSKSFSSITHDPEIWKNLHANAPFLRPPRQFPTAAFERAFVQSARLAQLWTTQGLRTESRVRFPFEGRVPVKQGLHLVGGRWLVVCQLDQRFVLYDTNIDGERREPQVIWEQAEEIGEWDKCMAISEEGQWILYVLLNLVDSPRRTLLEFRLDAESGALRDTVVLDVPTSNISDPETNDLELELDGGQKLLARSRFLYIRSQSLIFDTRTRVFYEFPEFCIARNATQSYIGSARKDVLVDIVLTNTHVIALHRFCHQRKPYSVVQAFAVPDDERPIENGMGVLRLSHEGVFSSVRMVFAIIQNSVVSQATGAINVKLLGRDWKYDGFQSVCINLTLQSSSDDISPILVNRQRIVVKDNIPYDDDLDYCNIYYDIADDGYARGLFMRCPRASSNSCYGVMKFSIDATQDRCVAVVGGFSRAGEWDDIVPPIDHLSYDGNKNMLLDCVRGRLSYIDEDSHGPDIENAAVVVVGIE